MKRLDVDYSVCMAAALNAGDRNMKKHGRKTWNNEDWDCAADSLSLTYQRLYEEANEEATE